MHPPHDEAPLTRFDGRSRALPLAAPRIRLAVLVSVLLAVGLVLVVLWSVSVGQFPITTHEILASFGRRLHGLPIVPMAQGPIDATQVHQIQVDGALWNVRLPRVALGLVVGACLGIAGCLTQGLFSNPLAEPGIIGTTSGAAVGACLVIVFGLGTGTSAMVMQPLGAFIGGVVTTALVYLMALSGLRSNVITIVLTGIAVNAVANAIIALLMFVADQQSRDAIVFWQLGSLNGALWPAVAATVPLLLVGLCLALLIAPSLDLLSLGESTARNLGVRVERLRIIGVILLAGLSAAAVAFAGIIGFVGLIIPHLFRLLLGPSHRPLIVVSALGGALLIAVADIGARTLVAHADLPIGMFTALLGGPVFYLLLRLNPSVREGDRR